MDWLVLFFLVPVVVVPFVLWFGFSGCHIVFGLDEVRTIENAVGLEAKLKVRQGTGILDVDLTWVNNEPRSGIKFRIERLRDGEADFTLLGETLVANPVTTTFTDMDVPVEAFFVYRVRTVEGENTSDPSPSVAINTMFTRVFNLSGALVIQQPNVGKICVVQRISASHFQGVLSNRRGMIARISLRGSSVGPLVIDRMYMAQRAEPNDPRNPNNQAPQEYDSLPANDPLGNPIAGGHTRVFDRDLNDPVVSLVPPTPADPDSNFAVLKLIEYTLDPNHDLLIAMDVPAPGNLLRGTSNGDSSYALQGGAEAMKDDRLAAGFLKGIDNVYMIENIDVIVEQ